MNLSIRKEWGQHFLTDARIAARIASAADIGSGEFVWEIGPGRGILTRELLSTGAEVTAFEIDRGLVSLLRDSLSEEQRLQIIEGDFLKHEISAHLPESNPVKIVANLPYQITSPFLFHIIDHAGRFPVLVLMIQREVALRLSAQPGTKEYGVLTLRSGFFYRCRTLFTVEPGAFFPRPSVRSAVIRLDVRPERPEVANPQLLWQIVRAAFGNRRKMLRKALRQIAPAEILDQAATELPFELSLRGEVLDEKDFIQLADAVDRVRRSAR